MNATKELFLKMKDGEKESELKICNYDEQHQLALIQGIFDFFDVSVDFKEMAEIELHTRKAYASFYNNQEFTEIAETNEPVWQGKTNEEPLEEELESPQTQEEVIENTEEEVEPELEEQSDKPDYYHTGVRTGREGEPRYRCRYICPKCYNQANRYIESKERKTTCHECHNKMYVTSATKNGFPEQDSHGNFFIAGKFEREIIKEEEENYVLA